MICEPICDSKSGKGDKSRPRLYLTEGASVCRHEDPSEQSPGAFMTLSSFSWNIPSGGLYPKLQRKPNHINQMCIFFSQPALLLLYWAGCRVSSLWVCVSHPGSMADTCGTPLKHQAEQVNIPSVYLHLLSKSSSQTLNYLTLHQIRKGPLCCTFIQNDCCTPLISS